MISPLGINGSGTSFTLFFTFLFQFPKLEPIGHGWKKYDSCSV